MNAPHHLVSLDQETYGAHFCECPPVTSGAKMLLEGPFQSHQLRSLEPGPDGRLDSPWPETQLFSHGARLIILQMSPWLMEQVTVAGRSHNSSCSVAFPFSSSSFLGPLPNPFVTQNTLIAPSCTASLVNTPRGRELERADPGQERKKQEAASSWVSCFSKVWPTGWKLAKKGLEKLFSLKIFHKIIHP